MSFFMHVIVGLLFKLSYNPSMKRLLLLLLLSFGLASISYGDHDGVVLSEAEAKAEAIRDAEQKVADEGRRIAEADEAEAVRIDQMNAPTAASIASKAEAVRIAAEKSAAESEASFNAPTAASIASKAEAVRIAKMNTAVQLTPDQLAAAAQPAPAPDAGKTPADIREEEKRIAYENSEAGREAKRIADEANLQSAAEAKRVAEAEAVRIAEAASAASAAATFGAPTAAENAAKASAVAAAEAASAADEASACSRLPDDDPNRC